ncbi:HCP-like protein, partial [Laetiporus sulphureus 93-53]
LMRHQNYSVPSLPSQSHPNGENEDIPSVPPPAYEETDVLGALNNMRISDPTGRMVMNHGDPIPRAGTSMSARSATSMSTHPAASMSPHRMATMPNMTTAHEQGGYAPPRGYPSQQGWENQHPGYATQGAPPGQNYNSMYAAASNLLGMGPPPGGALPPGAYYYSNNGPPQIPPNMPGSYLGAGPYQSGTPSIYSGSSQASLGRAPSIAPSSMSTEEEVEFRARPSLQRSGTTASFAPRTQKSKAIDLSAPPFTKEYIDEYRHRIKDDPDPEAHFLYAKYLIEAAKKFGKDAKDQKSVKRYRDTLIAESLKVMRRLATQGNGYDEAQFFLANCHGTGMLGLPVDHERAYHLYLQAAKQNHAAACYRVAVCNEIGAGTRKEPRRALAFYRKAASLGDTAAMYKLGCILLRGSLGEQENPRDAVNWLKRAAEQADEENPHALHELAMLFESPNNKVVPYDPAYAKELYTRAGHLGYTHSQYKLGQCYEYGSLTCPVDPRRSIAWYTKAAEKGHSEASTIAVAMGR